MIVCVCMQMCVCLCVSYSLHLLLLGSCYAVHINTLSIILKVYIERNNMQVELIRFRKKYRYFSRLRLLSEDFRNPSYVYSLFARWQLLATTKLTTIQCQPIRQMAAPHASPLASTLTVSVRKDTTPTVP